MTHTHERGRKAVAPPPSPPSPPTPIVISRRTRGVLLVAGGVALLLVLWQAPSVVTLSLGGAALAVVLSFPAGLLSRAVPRGIAVLLSFLIAAGLLVGTLVGLVPVLFEQLASLIDAVPGIASRLGERVPSLLERLAARGLLPSTADQFLVDLKREMLGGIQSFASHLLGQLGGLVAGTVGTAVILFGVIFIAAYLLADARSVKAIVLRASPHRYRRDTLDLWNAFRFTLSRYLGGLAISLAIQGVLSAVGLYLIGVPYAALLGAWVSITALVPFLGAWIGAVPAVLLALSISPTTALLTGLLYLGIQQLEGNILTPRIQGRAVRVHPVIIFLAVIAAGEIAGLVGVIFAVPAVAVLRVLFDFFRARIRTADSASPRLSRHSIQSGFTHE